MRTHLKKDLNMTYVMLCLLTRVRKESRGSRMTKLACPKCGGYIDKAEQDKVERNFYVCGTCFTIITHKRAQ